MPNGLQRATLPRGPKSPESDADVPAETHVPVLFNEVLAALRPYSGGKYIDGTLGAGGHAAGILSQSAPAGRLLGLDCDPAALAAAHRTLAIFGDRAEIVRASYVQMEAVARTFAPVDGILLDLGLSSLQLADPARGFAFQAEGPLDMRFDPQGELTAAEMVNEWPLDELADIFYRYGEERHSRKIAQAIGAARPIQTTRELAEVIEKAVGRRRGPSRIHPATRIFQALRIAVNGELKAVETVLPLAVKLLKPGGRLAVIAFHSLEDRIVKNFIREQAHGPADNPALPMPRAFEPELKEIVRKPVMAAEAEISRNPRARSAKLRIAEKLA
jgi:16S rRNA (cytosine1402-N4)-methyltransferase